MVAGRNLGFLKIPIFNFGRVWSGAVHHQAKVHHYSLISCGDIAILNFSKWQMSAILILDFKKSNFQLLIGYRVVLCIIMQNFTMIA